MGVISKRYFHDIKRKELAISVPTMVLKWPVLPPPPASVRMGLQAVLESEAEFKSGTT